MTCRFLVDADLPASAAARLRGLGFDAVGAAESGLAGASVEALAEFAAAGGRVLVTADVSRTTVGRPHDFPGLLVVPLDAGTPSDVAGNAVAEAVRLFLEQVPREEDAS